MYHVLIRKFNLAHSTHLQNNLLPRKQIDTVSLSKINGFDFIIKGYARTFVMPLSLNIAI